MKSKFSLPLSSNQAIGNTSDKEIVSAGQPFNWIIEYYNSSDATDDIVRLIDNLPTGVTLNSVSHQWNAKAVVNGKPAGLINLPGNANLTTTANADGTTTVDSKVAGSPALLNDLLTEEGGLLYLNVTINSTIPSGSLLINNVRGIGKNGSNFTVIDDQDPVSVFNPDLAINKMVDNDMPNNGDVAKFTLVVSNQGLVDAPSVVITDILPAWATYVSGSASLLTGGYTLSEPTVVGSTLTWNNLTCYPCAYHRG